MGAEHIESLAQGIAHTQAADEYAGHFAICQMRTTQPRQLQFRLMLATEHQILTVDPDREIAAMPKKHHFACIRGPGGSYFYSRFHGGILVETSGSRQRYRSRVATVASHSLRSLFDSF
jgi:hypothetical protein